MPIVEMVGDVFQKLDMLDKYKKLKKKYPPPKWEYRYIKGKRVKIWTKLGQNRTEIGSKVNNPDMEVRGDSFEPHESEEVSSDNGDNLYLPETTFIPETD